MKIRPHNNSFPLSLADIYKDLSVVFNILDCYPKYTTIVQWWVDMNKYQKLSARFKAKKYLPTRTKTEFKKNLYVLAHDESFAQCFNLEVANYPDNDWGIILFFDDEDIWIFPSLIKHFLHKYTERYIEFFSKDNYEFTRREDRRLNAFIVKWMWTLEIDPTKKGDIDWVLTLLIIHWLNDQVYIFDINPESIFPYALNFKTRIEYHDEEKKPTITFKIQWRNVLLKDKILFDSKVYEDQKIISFIVKQQTLAQIGDIYNYLFPWAWKPSDKEKKQLKDKITRMRKVILKNTWLDMFESVWLRKVTLNTKVSVILE